MILSDSDIRKLCCSQIYFTRKPIISPFSEAVSGNGIISYGLTSAGYDLRLAGEILVFKNTSGDIVDPKRFKEPGYVDKMFDKIIIPEGSQDNGLTLAPHSYILGRSLEYLCIPKDLKGHCLGKSTYARCGVIVNTTPLEPGWEGYLTIEIGNVSSTPTRIYAFEGIAQLELHQLFSECETDYAKKGGKYQGQTEVTPARVV